MIMRIISAGTHSFPNGEVSGTMPTVVLAATGTATLFFEPCESSVAVGSVTRLMVSSEIQSLANEVVAKQIPTNKAIANLKWLFIVAPFSCFSVFAEEWSFRVHARV